MDAADDIDVDVAGPPERVGRYRIGPKLAHGGMASVHLASPLDAPADVLAIKLVHPQLADDADFVEMFLDEARITSRIVHPHVCRVFEYGEADDTLFLTMELLHGISLTKLARTVKRKPALLIDPRWPKVAAHVLRDVCAGLHAAHELTGDDGAPLHVVHRDVSPQNIFVTWDGSAKILDFGIAAADHRLHKTAAGTVKGKFSYITPEQIQSKPVDRRADVWALGVVLWELLAGRSLFKGASDAQTVGAVLTARVPSIEGAPPELEAIIAGAIRVDQSARTPDAARMQAELEAYLGDFGTADVAAMIAELLPSERAAAEARVADHIQGTATKLSDVPTRESTSIPAISHVRSKSPLPAAPAHWPRYLLIAVLALLTAGGIFALGQHLRNDHSTVETER